MIELRVARGSRPTGRVLRRVLEAAGISSTDADTGSFSLSHRATAVVGYGRGYSGNLPALNRNAGRYDKLEQLQVLQRNEVAVPGFMTSYNLVADRDFDHAWLGRQRQHQGGTDILPVFPGDSFRARGSAGAQFFTQFIPSDTEYRVWVYRRRHLGTYEKVLAYPQKYRSIGRNYDNGFAFRLVPSANVPREAVDLAAKSVQALGLDFGAVDVLKGCDGRYYVLECNTAPGVEGPDRQVIQALAEKIAKWVRLGYPKRNGEEAA